MKIVMIGGGSVLWTPRLGCDLLLEGALDGSELVLVDIDRTAAERTAAYLETAVKQHALHWKIRVSGLAAALKNADLVLVSISTGGFEAMMHDYSIPEKYGIFHTVGDTVGPGGISRALRNIPVFLELAAEMNRLCPDAWMNCKTKRLPPCKQDESPKAVIIPPISHTIICYPYNGGHRPDLLTFSWQLRSDIHQIPTHIRLPPSPTRSGF